MRVTRRKLLGTVAGTIAIAGCTGSPDSNGDPTTDMPTASPTQSATGTPTAAMTTAQPGSAAVQVATHPDLGDILVGPDGMTLYMFDQDTQGTGESACHGNCEGAWPPLTVEGSPTAGDGVTASVDAFDREGGSRQVTADGWPLYYFANDAEPGDANGQGAGGVWWVLRPDGTPVRSGSTPTPTPTAPPTVQVRSHPEHGEVLAGPDGMTLYMFDQDTQGAGESACYGDCAGAWPPLTVEDEPVAGDGVPAPLTTFERESGERQVAANGWPLYYFANDAEPGDANGQGVGDVWWVLTPDGTPVRAGMTPTATPTSGNGGGGMSY